MGGLVGSGSDPPIRKFGGFGSDSNAKATVGEDLASGHSGLVDQSGNSGDDLNVVALLV